MLLQSLIGAAGESRFRVNCSAAASGREVEAELKCQPGTPSTRLQDALHLSLDRFRQLLHEPLEFG